MEVVTCKPSRNGRTPVLSFQQGLEAVLVLGNTHQLMVMVKLKVPQSMTVLKKKKNGLERKEQVIVK